MSADPRPARRHITQQRIQGRAGLALMDRIDPDEHPVDGQELRAYLVGEFLVINSRRGIDASSFERLEDAVEPIVLGCACCRAARSPRQTIATL